jgi:hypothetical protein
MTPSLPHASWLPEPRLSYGAELWRRLRHLPPIWWLWLLATFLFVGVAVLVLNSGSFGPIYACAGIAASNIVQKFRRPVVLTDPMKSRLHGAPLFSVFPCEITLEREGVLLGRDSGLVSFDKGTLIFEGTRCSFVLPNSAASVILGSTIEASKRPYIATGAKFALTDEAGGGTVSMAIPSKLDGWKPLGIAREFGAALRAWDASKRGTGATPLLPPVDPHPSAFHQVNDRRVGFGVVVLAATGLAGTMLYFGGSTQLAIQLALVLLGVVLSVVAYRARRGIDAHAAKLRSLESPK